MSGTVKMGQRTGNILIASTHSKNSKDRRNINYVDILQLASYP